MRKSLELFVKNERKSGKVENHRIDFSFEIHIQCHSDIAIISGVRLGALMKEE